ncbi:MAG: hypothetical protein D6731_06230 [Planctomycetota bacterium]|nr:MAG: hypothetical protein D6731_06230 [Planctomycetota bacterium]
MIRDTRTERYLEVGDRLVAAGKFKRAAEVYSRYADACQAQTLLHRARRTVESDPHSALRDLAIVERLVGPSGEGRRLVAEAYSRLGHPEIAARFFAAASK